MRGRGIVVVAFWVLLVFAAPAAGAKLRKASAFVTALGGSTGGGAEVSAVARCPKGTKAISGGYTTSAPQIPGHWLAVNESAMTPSGRAWRVSGFEYFPAPASDTLIAHAYCEKRKRTLVVASPLRTDFIPDSTGSSTASLTECPFGRSPLSGGFRTAARNAYFFADFQDFRGKQPSLWVVAVVNVEGAGGTPYEAEAYCGANSFRRTAKRTLTGPGTVSVDTKPCPKRRPVAGGGFSVYVPSSLSNAALVFDTQLVGRSWHIEASSSGPATSVVGPLVNCRR